jgi:hypothetical protein
MDKDLLTIVIVSTVVFFGVIFWKLRWFYKKMLESEQQQLEGNQD